MISLSYINDETSAENGNPIECYHFVYGNVSFQYTSSQYTQSISVNGSTLVFNPEYIDRGDSLKLGDSGGTIENCTITVARNNPVALLYQGAPPEDNGVYVTIYRKHGEGPYNYIIILRGNVVQVRFTDSEAEMTVNVENILNREVPRGKLSYFCQNCIYDNKCKLDPDMYKHDCTLDGGIDGLALYSSNLLSIPSGYVTDGFMKMGNIYRAIHLHDRNYIIIKYKIPKTELRQNFTVYPGCSNLFTNCADKFNNTDNFSGVPYIMPFDAYKNPVSNRQVYWEPGPAILRRNTGGEVFTPNT